MPNGLLIVGDASSPLLAERMFAARGMRVDKVCWDSLSVEQLRGCTHALLIVDATSAAMQARKLFRQLSERPLDLPICAIVPGSDAVLVQLATELADDFLIAPAQPEELQRRAARLLGPETACSAADIAATLAAEVGMDQLIGRDAAFVKVLSQLPVFAANEAPVLLTGETGTGKELCARVLHLLSRRHLGPFIPVDCGALPDHLFENEMFGHARGAYTDARADQKGLVALAQNGTLFLDEVDSLSLAAQSKILRLLQEQTYRPLGSEVFKQANVRVLAATNRDLETLVEQKMFRSDLFFRINVLRLRLPSLRERASDIPLLSRHFAVEIARNCGVQQKHLSAAAEHRLQQYAWPGNVRELYNIVHRAMLCSAGACVSACDIELPMRAAASESQSTETLQDFRKAKLAAVQSFERRYIASMMTKHQGNITQAAREAGKDRRAFGRLAKKYTAPSPDC